MLFAESFRDEEEREGGMEGCIRPVCILYKAALQRFLGASLQVVALNRDRLGTHFNPLFSIRRT